MDIVKEGMEDIKRVSNKVLEILQEKFHPLKVVDVGCGYDIVASTGKYSYSYRLTPKFLTVQEDFDKMVDWIKAKLHYEIERKMMIKKFTPTINDLRDRCSQGYFLMPDIACPEDVMIKVFHPTKYAELLR